MGKSVAFHNLGCKVNSYEMEIMIKELTKKGFLIVPFDQKADIYIVNTCSVTNIADRKSRQMIHRARAVNPDAVVVAAGCYANTHDPREMITEGIDICVVNEEKKNIADILEHYFADKDPGSREEETDFGSCGAVAGEYSAVTRVKGDTLSDRLRTRCFIKVQDGCDQFCTYCIIPYARGRIRSRTVKEIIEEIKTYAGEGYREFVPTGIHISSYGKDRPGDGEGLLTLLQSISETEGVERIRLSSLEPRTVTKEFAKSLSQIGQICPHFHLSLQSGSDSVLKRMNRHYDSREYLQALDILRGCFTDPAITTDIITGFPGETETEFAETVALVEKAGFYETHVFKYSRRKGTAADRMPDQLTEAVKHERSKILLDINRRNKRIFEDRHIASGRKVEVLFEDIEKSDGVTGRVGYTREYIKVFADRMKYAEGDIALGGISRQGDIIRFI